MLQIAVTGFHPFVTVRKEQHALIRSHGIHPFLFFGQFSAVPAFRFVMTYELPVLLVLLQCRG